MISGKNINLASDDDMRRSDMIWLIDYTSYRKEIDPFLAECKNNYFKIKSYLRMSKIGETAPVKTKVYSNGLLRIATLLHYNDVEIKYIHHEMLEEYIRQNKTMPEKVAFSAICPTMPLCEELAKKIKEMSPSTEVIIGGVHVNLNPSTTLKRFTCFDRINDGYEYEAAEKLAGKPLTNKPKKYLDFSLLPYKLSEYSINTFTTMGCPFHCDYCSDGMSPHFSASFDGQISDMMQLLPPKTLVHFFDSCFGYSPNGIRNCCEAIRKTDHNLLLSCDMRADIINPELIDVMQRAGFVEIRMGMESSDDELLKKNHRTLSIGSFEKQIEMIRNNSDFYITLYSITGLPGTTERIQKATVDYCGRLLLDHTVDEIKNGLYVPYPIENVDYSKRGIRLITDDFVKYDRQSYPVFETDDMSAGKLWEMYLYTAQKINEYWLRACGFKSFDEIPIYEGYYQEYIKDSYLK